MRARAIGGSFQGEIWAFQEHVKAEYFDSFLTEKI